MEKEQDIEDGDSIDYNEYGANLGDDLLMEIYSRLPTKSLFRLKCVSKAWCNLISNHSIKRRLHLAMSGVIYQILSINPQVKLSCACISGVADDDIQNMSHGFWPSSLPNFEVIDCCNGLLLCLSTESEEGSHYYVCNPVTKECILLPEPRDISDLNKARLVYDPHVSPHFKVIGISDVLRLFTTRYIMLEIFSSDDGKWVKSQGLSGRVAKTTLSGTAVYLNGTLNMLAFPHHIVHVDLGLSCHSRIDLPPEERRNGLLGKCRGRLCYIVCDTSDVRAWVLEDYSGSKWVLKHDTKTQTLQEKLLEYLPPLCVFQDPFEIHILALHPDFEVVFFETSSRLYAYDLASPRLVEICILTQEGDHTSSLHGKERLRVYPFTPCLNSLAMRASIGY